MCPSSYICCTAFFYAVAPFPFFTPPPFFFPAPSPPFLLFLSLLLHLLFPIIPRFSSVQFSSFHCCYIPCLLLSFFNFFAGPASTRLSTLSIHSILYILLIRVLDTPLHRHLHHRSPAEFHLISRQI